MVSIVNNYNPKDYRRKNHRWVKVCLEFIEFLAVVLTVPLSIYLVKEYMIPDMEIAIWEGVFFTVFLLISWYVFSRTVSMARLPRTQRYLTMIIQFSRVYFIILISLLAVKVIFRFTSIPVELIFIYVFMSITAVILLRLTLFRTLKIYRANGYNLHHVVVIADAFSDSTIESLINQKEWGFKINTILTNSKLIKAKYGDEINILPESADLKNIMDQMIIDEVLYCKMEIDENLVKRIIGTCNEVGVIFRFQSSVSPLDPFEMQLTLAEC
jgi:FlaA1/EpsC-like NDP-sugar epimerase